MFIAPFLLSPTSYSVNTYKNINFKFPLLWNSEPVEKNNPLYQDIIETLPGYDIKNELNPFLDRHGIRKDLIFAESPNMGFCAAAGTNYFTKSDAAIFVAPGFHSTDKNACNWLLKHEISHIKNNDTFTMNLVPAICSTAAAIFGTIALTLFSTVALTFWWGMCLTAYFLNIVNQKLMTLQ